MASNIIAFGASRNIGYFAALRFLNAGSRVTFLLRSPASFDDDAEIQKHVKTGKAQLVKGDALVPEDVSKAWEKATENAPVDFILYTVGFTGSPKFSLTKGLTMSIVDLSTRGLQNVLCTMPQPAGVPLPKIIVLSTTGASRKARSKTPLMQRPLYGYLIQQQMADKLGMERVIAHCAGWTWTDEEPVAQVMGEGWKQRKGLPAPGTLTEAVVLRASLLTDGECKAEGKSENALPYHAVEGVDGGATISRKDVAHFVFEAVTKKWDKYVNKQISVSY